MITIKVEWNDVRLYLFSNKICLTLYCDSNNDSKRPTGPPPTIATGKWKISFFDAGLCIHRFCWFTDDDNADNIDNDDDDDDIYLLIWRINNLL